MLGSKVVVSLDIFDYPGGSELKDYPAIISYVTKHGPWPNLSEKSLKFEAPSVEYTMI
jgi:hypothetical protein